MSDLAPFVAATIKDKVVEDLKKENDRLREEIRQSKSFQITSYNQQRVFAAGNVEDGHFASNINLWVIPLEPQPQEEGGGIPWKEFQSFETYCGGAMLMSHLNVIDNASLCFHGYDGSNEASTEMTFSFDAHVGTIYLDLRIKNWNPEVLSQVRQVEWGHTSRNLSRFLRSTLEAQPNLTFEFYKAVVSTKRILGILKRIPLDERNAKILAKVELRLKMRFEVRRIAEDQMGVLNELDADFGQFLDLIVDDLEEEDNTDTDSPSFVTSVIQKLPI